MKNLIIKKKGLGILKGEKVTLVSNTKYLSEKDDCLTNILNPEYVKNSYEKLVNEKTNNKLFYFIESIEKQVSSVLKDNDYVDVLIKKIESAENKRDLEEVYKDFINLTDDKLLDRFDELHRKNSDLTLSILAKSIIKAYVTKIINSNKRETIEKLEMIRLSGKYPSRLLKLLSIEPTEKSINNGVYKYLYKTVNDILDNKYMSSSTVCWYCENCSEDKCEKIRDAEDKDITRYDFVTDGYEIRNNNKMEKLVITGCSNLEFSKTKQKKNVSRLERRKSLLNAADLMGIDDINVIRPIRVR